MTRTKTATIGKGKNIEVFATGCDPIVARIYTWTNGQNEAHHGHCVKVTIIDPIIARGFEQADNALEAAAAQLETLAAKVRAMKGSRS